MIGRIYNKYVKERFFNKILISYTCVIILVLSILSFFIYQNILSSQRNKATNYNLQVVQNINTYFELKNIRSKQILQQLYLGQNSFIKAEDISNIFSLLENDTDYLSSDYLIKNDAMLKYLKSSCALDFDILGIYVLKTKDNKAFYYNINSNESNRLTIDIDGLNKFLDKKHLGTKMILTHNVFYSDYQKNTDDIFTFISNVNSASFNNRIGLLMINFSKNAIKALYSNIDDNFKSNVLVLTQDGEIVFDSSDLYTKGVYSDFQSIKKIASASPVTLIDKKNVVNVVSSNETGLIIISTLPNSDIYKNISSSRNAIVLILILSILVSLIMLYSISKVFSKRVKQINITMRQVESGNLSSRIKVHNNKDEISQIASNFNNMCDNLNEYINKVYVADLKRKDAELKQRTSELYALQAQINPHFLYNTLETIRMRALTTENEEVSKMIRTLAELFRSSIKKKIIVKISDEINFCKNYLEIYKIRYGHNLEINYKIEDDILEYAILKHLLQPLIENSIVHGIDTLRGNNQITLSGSKSGDHILFTISDNGNGISSEKLLHIQQMISNPSNDENDNIGLVNIDQRIKLIFGETYGIKIISKKDFGTTIEVKIAAKTVKELEENVQGYVS